MGLVTNYGIKIYLDEIFTPDVYFGLTHYWQNGCWTTIGSPVIYRLDASAFIVGRKVKCSAGFPSATVFYTVLSKTSDTITINANATSTIHGDGITVSQQSELRWAERTIRDDGGLDWYGDWLIKDSLDNIEESGDLSRGGAPSSYKGLSVTIKNTGREFELMKAQGIFLTGKRAEVVRFIGTEADPYSIEKTIVFSGICEDPVWTETELEIPIKNNFYKRDADCSTSITEGQNKDSIVPMTFGTFIPDDPLIIESLAKFLRTDDTQNEDLYTNEFFTGTDPQIKRFPLWTKVNDTTYLVKTNGNVIKTIYIDTTNDDLYVFVKAGTGTNQIRQVIGLRFNASPSDDFEIIIKDVFYTELSTVNDNTRSWLQLIKVSRFYMDDVWPCKSFLDESGIEVEKAQLYSFTDDKYQRIADYGFTVADANKNFLDIDGQQYSEDIDKLKSFLILPVASDITRISTLTLDGWQNHSGYTQLPSQPGLFLNNFTGYNSASGNIINNPGNVHDKDSTTFAEYNPTVQFGSSVPIGTRLLANAMRFSLPVIPKNIKVTNMYFGVKMKTHAQWINFVMRRFAYSNSDDIVVFTRNPNTGDDPNVDCLPDFYYNDAPETNNLHFYKESAKVGLTYENVFGYTLFKMPNCTPDIFNLYEEGAVISVIDSSDIVGNATTLNKIYELAIILELEESDIKKEIFSPVKGRIFNDTWGARKTAINLIENPIDIIEHCKRLGNWSEFGNIENYGKAYSADAKIKTSGEGSFDSSTLDDVKLCRPSFQIENDRDAWINSIVKELCNTFGVCTYIDKDGYECIKRLEEENVAEEITIRDIVGTISPVKEPKSSDIFCEPILNYQYDYGRGKFNKQLKVTNITADAWQSAYTPGFVDIDGEAFWNFCKRLYIEFGTVEKVPADFSDKKMIRNYQDALYYLSYKLNWVRKKRISLSVKYSKGKDYHFAQHVNLKLPHQTSGEVLETVIESVSKSKKTSTIKLTLVIIKNVTLYVVQDIVPGGSPILGTVQDHDIDLLEVKQDHAKGV